uniref:Cilia and flagella associated protein 298 n=1 Tax=Rousettus aegyptiacus TaxID=9407 RepID=A0A7J8HNH4_ROUAE|nr:cilia and flagella associated protein 298 [Rousettus aegyptiacus]
MVLLHVKRGDESQFLLQAPGSTELEELTVQVARIYNARLKVQRLCSEMEELAEHGVFLPPNMQGLTDDQIEELKLRDEWGEKCIPSGGSLFKKDDIGRRNGQETSGSQRLCYHGDGEGCLGPAPRGSDDCLSHGLAALRSNPDGI